MLSLSHHCDFTAKTQERPGRRAIQVGADDGLPPPPISGHRATGPSARARSPVEDIREGRLQFPHPQPLPQRGRWHLCEDTSHDCCQCLSVTPGGILPSQYGPRVAARPRRKQCAVTGHPGSVTVPWKGADAKSANLSWWTTMSEL